MNRMFSLAVSAAVLAAPLAVADNPNPDAPTAGATFRLTDEQRIEGTWVLEAVEQDGKVRTDGDWYDSFRGTKWTYKGGLMWTDENPDGKIRIILGPDKRPATYTLIYNPREGTSEKSLYEFRGETLRVCVWPSRDAYPPVFDSMNGRIILIKVRDKSAPK
jgi:uncharacterized protein (TIGR03067 family)